MCMSPNEPRQPLVKRFTCDNTDADDVTASEARTLHATIDAAGRRRKSRRHPDLFQLLIYTPLNRANAIRGPGGVII